MPIYVRSAPSHCWLGKRRCAKGHSLAKYAGKMLFPQFPAFGDSHMFAAVVATGIARFSLSYAPTSALI